MDKNIKNTDEPMEEDVPPILSATGRLIFPLFAKMLDIKSFLRLASASKEMHEMCMNDKRFKITVCHKSLHVDGEGGLAPVFTFNPFGSKHDNYFGSLRKLNCHVSLDEISIRFRHEFNKAKMMETRRYLEELSVKNIKRLSIVAESIDIQELSAFMKDFRVERLCISSNISEAMLSSILQWNLSSFSYAPPFPFEIFLDSDSPIVELEFKGNIGNISRDEFFQCLSKIENGRLRSLTIRSPNNPFADAECLTFGSKQPLPADRPLVFFNAYCLTQYFLHSSGIVSSDNRFRENYEISRCDPKDYPPLLKTKEQVFDDFRKGHSKFSCYKEDFDVYFKTLPYVPCNHEGALPDARPLVFRDSKHSIWLLKEDGTLSAYCWADFIVTVEVFDLKTSFPRTCRHSALTKHVLFRIIEETAFDVKLTIDLATFCDGFNQFKNIPFQAYGELPADRPLVFKKTDYYNGKKFEQRRLLKEDGRIMKCGWKSGQATFTRCDPKEYPIILTKTIIKDFLMGKEMNGCKDLYVDRDVLNEYLKYCQILPYDDPRPLLKERPLIFLKSDIAHVCEYSNGNCDCIYEILDLWVLSEENVLTFARWGEKEDRHLVFVEGSAVTYLPQMLRTRNTLESFVHGPCPKERKLYWCGLFEDFVSYFKSHRMFDFNHNGRLPRARPIVFVKNDEVPRQFSDFWYLRNDDLVVMCTWMNSYAILTFSPPACLPPALRR